MLSVILVWIYVLITTYILGFAALRLIVNIPYMYTAKGKKQCVYTVKYHESALVAGIILVTVYAQMFSLVKGVGLAANLLLVATCFALALGLRDELLKNVSGIIKRLSDTKELWLYLGVFLLMAYGTSHGLMHYDTDLYHAQAIRWIEEYGIVRGLGNLHLRLGYNSASFALSALFSMSFLGKSLHVMAGYFALLLAWQCVDIVNLVRRRHPILSDFVRVVAIYYLFTIFDEMVSPASDYFMTTITLYIVIHWLDLYAIHERSFLPHALLSLTALYAATIKLSAAPFVLLSIYPIARLIRKRKKGAIKPILYFVILGAMIALPFVFRSAVLTGWLVYPFTGIDLLNVSWKVPYEQAVADAREIIAYGRGFTDPSGYYAGLSEWLPSWIGNLGLFNKLMLLLDVLCVPVFIACFIYYLIGGAAKRAEKNRGAAKVFQLSHRKSVSISDFLFVASICYAALLYWLFSSPLVRYGCVYLWLPCTIIIGRFVIYIYDHFQFATSKWIYKTIAVVIVMFIVYKMGWLIWDDIPRFSPKYFLMQQDYNSYELESREIDGITFYYPTEGDRTGYDPFPSAPSLDGFKLLGNELHQGFAPSR